MGDLDEVSSLSSGNGTAYSSFSINESEEQLSTISHDNAKAKLSLRKFVLIEVALFTNVFLSGFDGTVTASTYSLIGNSFQSADLASWITTSYLITATSFQPLYGSFSDILGRRKCVMFAVSSFAFGCLGCSIAGSITMLNFMRALTGVGGGGLLTLATIINSDIIPTKKRGLFQAFQNLLLGFGAICGASFGGIIADTVGWRWCFISQVPLAIFSLIIGYFVIENQPGFDSQIHNEPVLQKIDIKGALILVLALTVQLLVLTLGGNELAWSDYRLISFALFGICLLVWFTFVELNTHAIPIIPLRRFKSLSSVFQLCHNFLIGLSSYAYLFALPLLFHIVLGDSPSTAGLRLAIPSLSTPIGGLITGYLMNRYGLLKSLVYTGTFVMSVGNFLALLVNKNTESWVLNLLLVPANIGQGLVFPSSLFTFIFSFGPEYQATSTSMVYLSRSIGGVFGVSGVSAIIQGYLRYKVTKDLTGSGLDEHDVASFVSKLKKSTDVIFTLPPGIRDAVLSDYEDSIRIAQLFSSLCCSLAFIICILRDISDRRKTI